MMDVKIVKRLQIQIIVDRSSLMTFTAESCRCRRQIAGQTDTENRVSMRRGLLVILFGKTVVCLGNAVVGHGKSCLGYSSVHVLITWCCKKG